MCNNSNKGAEFMKVAKEIDDLKFDSRPNYDRLRKMMEDLYMNQKNKEFEVYF